MPGGRASCLLGVHAIVAVDCLIQTVLVAAKLHELPHMPTAAALDDRARNEAGFGLREVNQFLRYPFFIQHALESAARYRPETSVAATIGSMTRGPEK